MIRLRKPRLSFSCLIILFRVILILGMLFNNNVFAENSNTPLKKTDFAYGLEFSPKNNQALQAISLSEHFYQNTISADGGDFRVFDASNREMPFTTKTAQYNIKDLKKNVLEFYPVYGKSDADLNALSFALEKERISLLINDQKSQATEETSLLAYIIDTQDLKNITSLNFDWDVPKTGFINSITLEQSNDLMSWTKILSNGSLSRLNHLGKIIGNNKLTLAHPRSSNLRATKPASIKKGISARYLRMTWGENTQELIVQSVESESNVFLETQKNQYKNITLTLNRTDKHTDLPSTLRTNSSKQKNQIASNNYTLSLPGRIPVTEFEFLDANNNYFYQASLFGLSSRYIKQENKQQWKSRGDISQYHLNIGQQQLKNKVNSFNPTKHSEWLFSFTEPKNFNGVQPPNIKVTWLPEKLLFIAKGTAPYTLAYGNPQVDQTHHNLSSIVNQLKAKELQKILIEAAYLDTPIELGGIEKLQAPKPGFPWKTALLWLVLILGVSILGRMSWVLFKQEHNKKESST